MVGSIRVGSNSRKKAYTEDTETLPLGYYAVARYTGFYVIDTLPRAHALGYMLLPVTRAPRSIDRLPL